MSDISLIFDTNADEATRDVDRLRTSTNNLGNAMVGTAKDTKVLAAAQQSSGNVARTAGRKMSGTGMAIQQVGYQTGDFLVQIQGGTNAMVAFGQQATQLVGVLPMVADNLGLSMGAAIGLSAGLGILIPLVTAVGAYFMRSGEQAKSFEDNLSDLETQVKDYAEATELSRDAMRGAREEFGYTSGVLQTIVGDLQIIARIGAFEKLGQTISALRADHISGFESDLENIKDLLQLGGWFDALSEEAIAFNSNLLTMEDSTKSLGFRLEAALDLRQILLDNSGGIENMTSAQKSFFTSLVGTIQQMEIMLGVGENIENNQKALVEGAEGFLSIWEAIKTAVIGAKEAMGGGSNLTDAQYQQMLYYQAYGESLGAAPDTPVKHVAAGKTPTRGAGSSVQKTPAELAAEAVAKLQVQLNLQRELIGMTEEEAHVRQALGETYSNVSQETITSLQQQYAETQKLLDLQKQQETIANTVANSFANAYTSMIDGTMSVKDAFKNMAREIIKQLWEIFVVEQLVASVKGAMGGGGGIGQSIINMFQADGGAWSNGVQMFANGGVVNSPTMFGHSGGLGVMGEAGPEAIMPLKRGSNGKLGVQMEGGGGGDTINVVQNFNMSANGDESVKRIIAQAAPKIAQMTKSSLLDDRRRGGATKAAFG